MLQIQQLLFSGVPVGKGEKQMPMERTFKVCPATWRPIVSKITSSALTAVCPCEDGPLFTSRPRITLGSLGSVVDRPLCHVAW